MMRSKENNDELSDKHAGKNKNATINFTGDLMVNIAQDEACKTNNGYKYDEIFERVEPLLSGCDYSVGNLETTFSGKNAGYSSKLYSFNTPAAFAKSIRAAGFNMVTTANNHCLDRGLEGLLNTLKTLEKHDLDHTGTYRSMEERNNPFLRNINGIRIGFVNYTYGTNAFANHCFLDEEKMFAVNLFQPQETLPGSISLLNKNDQILRDLEKLYQMPNPIFKSQIRPYLANLESDIQKCRRSGAEFIFVIMHSGGQYNSTPDAYTEYLVERIEQAGADMIIGHHPHVVHKFEYKNGHFPVAYSLGNFSFTPDQSPESSKNPISATALLLSVELRREKHHIKVSGLTFSTTRSLTLKNGKSIVVPLYDLINETKDFTVKENLIADNRYVVNTFLNLPLERPVPIQRKYAVP